MSTAAETPRRISRIRVGLPRRVPWNSAVTAAILAALIIADVSIQPALANLTQIGLLVETAMPLVMIAVAQTLIVLLGGIDLSVGGMFVVANAVTVVWVGGGGGAHQLLIVVAFAIGIAMGTLNGVLVTGLGFQPFIATLGTWTIYNGLALTILPTDGGTPPPFLSNFMVQTVFGVPTSIVMLIIVFLLWRCLRATRFGSRMYAVGADEERARLNGTSVRRVKLVVYSLAGLCAAIGGIYAAGADVSGTPTAGDAYILTSVAVVVIGGTSLRGGEGGIGVTLMGAMVLTLINDIVDAVNLSTWVSVAASAALLLVMVTGRTLVEAQLEKRRCR